MKRVLVLFLSLLLYGCGTKVTALPLPDPSPSMAPQLVVLDFGHGGFDGGAVGTETGVKESDLNLAVGMRVKDALEARGLRVLLTRSDENALAETKNADMQARGELLKTESAACTVSIHMNKFSDRTVSGPMAFYQPGSEEGQRLAQCVIDCVTEAIGKKPRLANPANNFVTRIPSAPSVLVECGFLSNPTDERNLMDETYQNTLAEAIADGVSAFLSEAKEDGEPSPSPVSP